MLNNKQCFLQGGISYFKKHYLFEHIFGIMLIGSFEGRDL